MIISTAEDIWNQLEEGQVTIATIKGSRYVAPIKVINLGHFFNCKLQCLLCVLSSSFVCYGSASMLGWKYDHGICFDLKMTTLYMLGPGRGLGKKIDLIFSNPGWVDEVPAQLALSGACLHHSWHSETATDRGSTLCSGLHPQDNDNIEFVVYPQFLFNEKEIM